ncbi:MAG: prepilin peptidase [Bacillati bacterium ANGP1]|uniref:Prepilin peptidase n=1 Tax=Candidatus Segetimicrobium genomatis TaxID=2569760 RepID=A0A537IUH1_9BACT|nr:MAG: prepilin peptidase [Terrabacteria group bacterium ANGP1]
MSHTVSTVMAFILGTILGSFLNVVIYRLPRNLSIVRPGSRCPHCQTPIRPQDNIPLVSFLVLRGRCRVCRAPIGWRYPLVEAVSGGLLAGVWLRFAPGGAWIPLVAAALFSFMLVAVFFIDLDHQIVPNAITYPGIVAGLLLAIPQGRLVPSVVVAASAGALFLLIAVVSHGGMGGGDIKMAAMMGAFLSWPATAVALLLAFMIGATAGVLLIAVKRRSRKDPIPFGPSLAAGGVIAVFAGDAILRWYLGR